MMINVSGFPLLVLSTTALRATKGEEKFECQLFVEIANEASARTGL